jgi:hypothetical protein
MLQLTSNQATRTVFITNANADSCPIVQAAMAAIAKRELAEETRRQRVRQGLEPAGTWGTWSIRDRH